MTALVYFTAQYQTEPVAYEKGLEMLRLSRLADYAVVIMSHMVAYDAPNHSTADTSAATSIPEPTVAKVMAKLTRAGLLTSQRGAKGGYVLARKADAISVADIVRAIDGPIALTHCVRVGAKNCDVASNCPSSSGLNRINLAVRSALEAVSLENLALPFGPLGPTPEAPQLTVKPQATSRQSVSR